MGLQDCPGHQVRSGSCSQEPSHSLSVQRFWKGAGSLPDVSNYELLWWALQEEFATSSVWHGDGAVSHWPAWCKNFPSCTGKEEGFPTSWVQFLAPWKSGQHGVSGFSVVGLIRSAGEVAKAAQAIVCRAGCLADPPGKAEGPWRRCTWWFQSTSHAPARCLGWGLEGAEDIEFADSGLRLMQCWRSVRPEQLPANTSVEASRAHNAPNRECSQSGVSGVPVVYEWNFPKAGLRASRIVSQVVPIIAQTCSSDPTMVIHIVVPPCRKGEAVGDERAESVAQNVTGSGGSWQIPRMVFAWEKLLAFGSPIHSTPMTETLGLSTGWWSVILAVPVQRCVQPHLWQLCFDEAWCFPNNDESNGAKGLCKLEAAFGVWRPEAPDEWAWKLPMVQCAQLFGAVLGELIKGSILTQNHVLVVVDGCLYDAETAKACLEQNCKQGNSQPRAIFLGLSWIQEKDLIRQGVLLIEHAATW